MTTLTLVRHGQASWGKPNYDELSPLGERQARLTGAHLARIGSRPDVVAAGAMQRQRHTAELVGGAWGASAAQRWPAFDEYDAGRLFEAYLPAVLMETPDLAANQRALFSDRKLFQRSFEAVTAKWVADEPQQIPGFEPWEAFRGRVCDDLLRIHREFGRDAHLVLCSSGGPIAVAVAATLGLAPRATLRLNWAIYNASITELRSTKTGWRLLGFNNITHLRLENDPDVVTLR